MITLRTRLRVARNKRSDWQVDKRARGARTSKLGLCPKMKNHPLSGWVTFVTISGAFISPGTRPSRPGAIVRREANAGEPDALTVTQAPDGLTEGKAVTDSRTKSRSLCGYGIGIAAVSARTIRKMLPQVPYHPVAAIRQPRSVPDLGYPTRKADTKAVKTHSGGHRTRTHTRPPSAAVTPVVPHRHGYASSSLSRFRMPGSTSCRTKSAKTPGIKLSC